MRNKSISMKRWLIQILVFVILVISAIMFAVTLYVGSEMKRQVLVTEEAVLSLYMQRIDDALGHMNKYLLLMPTSNDNISEILLADGKSSSYYYAEVAIHRELKKTILTNETFDGLFVYDLKNETFIQGTNERASYLQGDDIKSIVTDSANWNSNMWDVQKKEGKAYLIRTVKQGSVLCGAWISFDNLIFPLSDVDLGEDELSLFVDSEGMPLSTTTEKGQIDEAVKISNCSTSRLGNEAFFKSSKKSRYADISLVTLVPEAVIMDKVHVIQIVLGLISFGIVGLIPLVFQSINRKLYAPIREVAEKMKCVGEGNLSVRLVRKTGFSEFEMVYLQFNSMVDQIKTLQEEIYEKKILEQKTQLQYLQVQIRPHFFLNSLNIIFSFAEIKRYDLIQEMTLCLVNYFRYIFHQTTSFVLLREEKEHIENYMKIQELRYPGLFVYQSEIEPSLLQAELPPLVLQTFIENSIKYNAKDIDMEQGVMVKLTVEKQDHNGRETIRMVVSDNGSGYPQSLLDDFSTGSFMPKGSTSKIGIYNVVQRLHLMYGEQAKVILYNAPEGGAVSEIMLPIQSKAEEE